MLRTDLMRPPAPPSSSGSHDSILNNEPTFTTFSTFIAAATGEPSPAIDLLLKQGWSASDLHMFAWGDREDAWGRGERDRYGYLTSILEELARRMRTTESS